LVLLVIPAVSGFSLLFNQVLSLTYIGLIGVLSGMVEVRNSPATRVGGFAAIVPVIFRNVAHAGFLIVVGLLVGFFARSMLIQIRG